MPSNKELITQIKAIDENAQTDGLNNQKLAAMLKDLRAEAPKDEAPKDEAPAVAEGKAITTKRGILTEGMPVRAGDLAGGDKAFQTLIKSGHIIK